MREIEFRGKRVDNGEWIYGDLIHAAFDGTNVYEYGIAEPGCYPVEVDGKTVGQYTGLKDKNGDEIYEGDVVKDGYDTFTVLYLQGEFIIRRTKDSYDNSLSIAYYYIEIIGNVHDNPELLEKNAEIHN